VALCRPGLKSIEAISIKKKHLGKSLFKELTEDPTRYNNSNPFDESESVWLENEKSQELRRKLVSLLSGDYDPFRLYFFCDYKYKMVLNMQAPSHEPALDMDIIFSSSSEDEEKKKKEEKEKEKKVVVIIKETDEKK
jgi:hypothetical protein